MSRKEVRIGIFDQLSGSGVLALLGPVSPSNLRIYSAWPQVQPKLSQPSEADEGWLTFHERNTGFGGVAPVREDFTFEFNIWATTFTLTEDIVDIMDGLWHYKLAGHNSFLFGADRNVLWAERQQAIDLYEEETKLYRKMVVYQYQTVKLPFRSGA